MCLIKPSGGNAEGGSGCNNAYDESERLEKLYEPPWDDASRGEGGMVGDNDGSTIGVGGIFGDEIDILGDDAGKVGVNVD